MRVSIVVAVLFAAACVHPATQSSSFPSNSWKPTVFAAANPAYFPNGVTSGSTVTVVFPAPAAANTAGAAGLTVTGQAGGSVSGGADNMNGGTVTLTGGAAGTGGSGHAGNIGVVNITSGSTGSSKFFTIFPFESQNSPYCFNQFDVSQAGGRNGTFFSWGYNTGPDLAFCQTNSDQLIGEWIHAHNLIGGVTHTQWGISYSDVFPTFNDTTPLEIDVGNDTDVAAVSLRGDTFFEDNTGNTLFGKFTNGFLELFNASQIFQLTNNTDWIRQEDAAGNGSISMMLVDGSDVLQLAPTGPHAATAVNVTPTLKPTGGINTTAASSANQACTTTCSPKACIAGFDQGTSTFQTCASASSDTCLCGP